MSAVLNIALDVAAALAVAYACFRIARAGQGRGRAWVLLPGLLALLIWGLALWFDRAPWVPLLATLVFVLSLVGLAPDDSVLGPQVSPRSRRHRHGLNAALLGTVAGAVGTYLLGG